jgi:hypothetical protein
MRFNGLYEPEIAMVVFFSGRAQNPANKKGLELGSFPPWLFLLVKVGSRGGFGRKARFQPK